MKTFPIKCSILLLIVNFKIIISINRNYTDIWHLNELKIKEIQKIFIKVGKENLKANKLRFSSF